MLEENSLISEIESLKNSFETTTTKLIKDIKRQNNGSFR